MPAHQSSAPVARSPYDVGQPLHKKSGQPRILLSFETDGLRPKRQQKQKSTPAYSSAGLENQAKKWNRIVRLFAKEKDKTNPSDLDQSDPTKAAVDSVAEQLEDAGAPVEQVKQLKEDVLYTQRQHLKKDATSSSKLAENPNGVHMVGEDEPTDDEI